MTTFLLLVIIAFLIYKFFIEDKKARAKVFDKTRDFLDKADIWFDELDEKRKKADVDDPIKDDDDEEANTDKKKPRRR